MHRTRKWWSNRRVEMGLSSAFIDKSVQLWVIDLVDLDLLHFWALMLCSLITAIFAIGGLYQIPRHVNPKFKAGLFLSSMASLGGAAVGLLTVSFLPLLTAFAIAHALRWLGLDPGAPK
jgi:hypothetical protein